MTEPKRLAFLRHGVTAWNREGLIQGHTDIPLDAEGRAHLGRLALPPGWGEATLHASPLDRARETAELLGRDRPVRTDPRLMEMNWGDWEGCRGVDLRADPASGYRDLEHWGWDFRPPGGESPAELRQRLQGWLADVARSTGPDHLAVVHVGVIRVVLALGWGWDFLGPPPLAIKRDRLYAVTLAADGSIRAACGPEGIRLSCA
ncbi:putative phosphoglycerate mutase [Azospirillum agricola]|uniref:histidine phosphatase family protein n=1 Tax=Azospirillum agricola TaxID=1720247 RepID=UPI001AE4EF6F|nr:histidine phosphatase family protein [Azospirillum agricola]MBP2231533.1 putative phosphoglycerate mutase [Azospirillum agricola]